MKSRDEAGLVDRISRCVEVAISKLGFLLIFMCLSFNSFLHNQLRTVEVGPLYSMLTRERLIL